MKELALHTGWKLHEAPLRWGVSDIGRVMAFEDGWMDCALPCDVRMPLIESGVIKDPVLADYSRECEWISNRSWWFVREFDISELDIGDGPVELTLESLDTWAEIFLNGSHIGTHKSAHYPFTFDIKCYLRPGKNVLCIRLTTGLEKVTEEQLAELEWSICHEKDAGHPERGDHRRTWLRRPQYNAGWDFLPKAFSIGITGGAYVRCLSVAEIRSVDLETLEAGKDAHLRLRAEVEYFNPIGCADADLDIMLRMDGVLCAYARVDDILLTAGINWIDLDVDVQDAKLWWPAGSGAQPLYDVEVCLECCGSKTAYPKFQYGIRTIRLDISRQEDGRRGFGIVVNGVKIFCKGSNWVPNDPIYARVCDAKYEELIRAAHDANFNMLRIWGGGIYEREIFYRLCDRYGILIWHDFMLACGAFPDHDPDFVREMENEADYQTRRLRNHPSMCLWCGDNELHRYFWYISLLKKNPDRQFGLRISNYVSKKAVHANCSRIPYWNSSPFGGEFPDSEQVGDTHHWNCSMHPDMEKRIDPMAYDLINHAFVSEYGYFGAPSRVAIESYFDGQPVDRLSGIWDHHNNDFEKGTVYGGIVKHYMDNPQSLDLDGYILYSGMVQSLMYGYSLEALRFKPRCSGALFWMFNDSWGEVGWSVVDYCLQKKPSYYGVKRAFSHRKLILRQVDGKLVVTGCNDTPDQVDTMAEVGYISLDGRVRDTRIVPLTLLPYSRSHILETDFPEGDLERGVVAVIPESMEIAPERLFACETRCLDMPDGEPRVLCVEQDGGLHLTITSDVFLHGVYIEGVNDCSDNYFELLPGQVKTVSIAARLRLMGSEFCRTLSVGEGLCSNA
ncbi:beta-mannosidase [Muricomes sp. OA1]|uniref:beta-mannosidase n=1 Tax=Hungatella hathewayi TaxID=154046 RepID=A0A3E2WYC2_9FIRM|nr:MULTISPECIES: sugar-binding domain-containing protein [Clostridia]MCH1971398.1 beta-mannosidase [Muricomes sp. OA1]RGC32660.1 beta-mannosidase [Hungatella hathewayi]GKH34694.1 beta-mannosidase [Faecalicatena contorta]